LHEVRRINGIVTAELGTQALLAEDPNDERIRMAVALMLVKTNSELASKKYFFFIFLIPDM